MAIKGVSFGERDRELVEKIEEYQHEEHLPSFTEAVRRLCELGLKFHKVENEKS